MFRLPPFSRIARSFSTATANTASLSIPVGDVAAIVEALEKNDIKIDAIWLTHGHIDHAGGAMDLKEALGVEIVGPHKDDLKLLQGLEDQAQMFGVEARYAMSPLTGGSRKVKRYPSATMRSRSFIVPAMRPAT